MSRAKLTIKTTNRRRGTVSLTIIRKVVATAFAKYDEQRKARPRGKGFRVANAK